MVIYLPSQSVDEGPVLDERFAALMALPSFQLHRELFWLANPFAGAVCVRDIDPGVYERRNL